MEKPSQVVLIDVINRLFVPVYKQPSQELALDLCCARYNIDTFKPSTVRFVENGKIYSFKQLRHETIINYISVHDADEEE